MKENKTANTVYLPALDGIRGFAALLIMFLHFMPSYKWTAHPFLFLLKKASIIGQLGVPLFFVLSGFLITRILINSKNKENYFKSFYIKRALRIFPLYYLYLIISFFLIPILTKLPPVTWKLSWFYYFYLQNIAITFNWRAADLPHLWSLAVEEHFYFVWPVLIYFLPDKKIIKVIAGCFFLSFLCRILLIHLGIGTYYFTFTTMDALASGAFLSLNENHHWIDSKKMLQILFVSGFFLILFFPFATGLGNNYVQYLKNTVISVFCIALIGAAIRETSVLNHFFQFTFLRYTGKISYGLYIFHPTCYAFTEHYFHPNNLVVKFIICFFAAYGVATVSYYFFELKFLKLKSKFQLKDTTGITSAKS